MTKSTIARERMEEIRDCCWMDDLGLSMDELSELARMALAAMDSEPDCKERKLFCSTDTTRMRKTISVSAGTEDAPLYRHAQQPVVSAELLHTAASAIEDLLTTKDRMGVYVCFDLPFRLRSAANAQPAPAAPVCTCTSGDGSLRWPCSVHPGNSPVIPDGWTGNDKANAALMMLDRIETVDPVDDDRIDGIKCIVRELASATQPQNAPRNIPEIISGWIPVSEQMPEDRTQVILWDAEIGEVTSGHYSHKTHTFYHCGDAIENEITHWMPLPAGPQEVR